MEWRVGKTSSRDFVVEYHENEINKGFENAIQEVNITWCMFCIMRLSPTAFSIAIPERIAMMFHQLQVLCFVTMHNRYA